MTAEEIGSKVKTVGGLRLRPRSRMMTILGQELISSDVVALTELVKNAYDADARYVLIRVTGECGEDRMIEAGTGTIEILDDGHGMDETTIRGTWLEPATGFRRQSTTTARGRRVLGEKGVGRFATAKLGERLEMISKSEIADEVHLVMDWSAFEDDDRYLDEIELGLRVTREGAFGRRGLISKTWQAHAGTYLDSDDKPLASHGTLLTISGLRSDWTPQLLEEVYRALSRLVSPIDDERDISSNFKIVLDLPKRFRVTGGLIDRPDVLKQPHYKLSAEVDNEGHATVLIESEQDDELERGRTLHRAAQRPLQCGPFEVFLSVWDRDAASLSSFADDLGSSKAVRSVLDSAAGVSIYRDGFRVLPFGERGDDWLSLDRRRVQNPTKRLSNNQIVGYVLISRDRNPELIDQTNREGIMEGPAFDDLRGAVLELLSILETERYKLRPRRARKPKGGLLDRIDLGELQSAIVAAVPSDPGIQTMIVETQRHLNKRIEKIGEVLSRYRRLATLGQLIDRVVHELTQPIVAIRQAAAMSQEALDDASEQNGQATTPELLDKLSNYLARIARQAGVANDVVRRIDPFGGRRRGRPHQYRVEEAIRDAVALLREDIDSIGAEVCIPDTDQTVSLDGTEIQEVLVNLLSNSLHWLKQVRKGSRIIALDVERNHDGSLALMVEDSGPGVSESDREYIFDPYFTTKEDGVGLGLTIAGEIVEDYYDGSLELMAPGELGGARLRATLRKRVG